MANLICKHSLSVSGEYMFFRHINIEGGGDDLFNLAEEGFQFSAPLCNVIVLSLYYPLTHHFVNIHKRLLLPINLVSMP